MCGDALLDPAVASPDHLILSPRLLFYPTILCSDVRGRQREWGSG